MTAIPYNVDEIMGAINREVADIMREDARNLSSTVILATPVGNPYLWKQPAPANYRPGRARGGWRVSITQAVTQETGRKDTVGGATIADAFAQIEGYKSPTVRLYVQNNVPYIGSLNDGSSSQAPAGFVDRGIVVTIADTGESKEI